MKIENINMDNSSTKILVCYYKQIFTVPTNPIYLNLQCGKDETNLDLGMIADNTGDNISIRNRYWSEITGLYWAWRNMEKVDYIGLCSYRRFFNFKKNTLSAIRIIPTTYCDKINEIKIPNTKQILSDYDIIIPKPYSYAHSIRNVWIMNYREADFLVLKEVVHNLSPEYDKAFHSIFYSTNKLIGHNMFIMSWEHFDEYCKWVFSILFEVEKKINPTKYPISQVRVFGYMHELLLSVFIKKNNFKKYYSQIIWITDDSNGFKFNNIVYKILAALYYKVNKLLKQ